MSAAGAIAALALAGLFVSSTKLKRKPPAMTEIPLATLADHRRAAWALTMFAVDGDQGRAEHGDPVYTDITLGLQEDARASGWFFSSCAFLPHWLFETLGVVRPYVGRSRTPDEPLNRLAFGADSAAVTPTTIFETGDVVQIGSNGDSHVFVAIDYDPPGAHNGGEGHMLSADYGQPGGKLRHRRVYVDASGALIFEDELRSRPARRYVPLAAAIAASSFEYGPIDALIVGDPEILAWWEAAPGASSPSLPSSPSVARRAPARAAGGIIFAALAVVGAALLAKASGA